MGRQAPEGQAPQVVVAGAQNCDLLARAHARLRACDSNPGTLTRGYGGVGLNIALNLARLGIRTQLMSAYGSDHEAGLLKDFVRTKGIGTDYCLQVQGYPSSTYLAIHDESGEMRLAVSDMRLFDELSPDAFDAFLPPINRAKLLILDCNLPAALLKRLCDVVSVPLLVDCVSVAKAARIRPTLSKLTMLKPNRLEAAALCGFHVEDLRTALMAADWFLSQGLDSLCLSMGEEGLLWAQGPRRVLYQAPVRVLKNVTGAGDAFMAAYAAAMARGREPHTSLLQAMAAAVLTLESEQSVSSELCPQTLAQTLRRVTWQSLAE